MTPALRPRASRDQLLRRAVAVLLACLACAGSLRAASERSVWVSVAISFKPVLQEMAEVFEAAHADTRILLNAGGSGLLLQQARRGAPVDLFISASPAEIDRLDREHRLAAGSRRSIASTSLVVVVPEGGTPPRDLRDLLQPSYRRIAVGNPGTAPVGRYARQAFIASGVWDTLRPRLILAENARQVLDYVARGEVEAGVVYRTDTRLLGDAVVEGPPLPAGSHPPVLYEGAVLAGSGQERLAMELLESLRSPAGQRVLRRHGFEAAPSAP